MSAIHEFKCDSCSTRAKAKYNGEHYLVPQGWVQLYCDNQAQTLDEHLCPDCRPKKKKAKVARESSTSRQG